MSAARGFSLIEVLIALVVLEVGLLGCAGTLVLAQRHMAAAERLHQATQSAASVADSLLALPPGAAGAGEARAPWGTLRWEGSAAGVVLRAADRAGAPLLEWWIPLASGA